MFSSVSVVLALAWTLLLILVQASYGLTNFPVTTISRTTTTRLFVVSSSAHYAHRKGQSLSSLPNDGDAKTLRDEAESLKAKAQRLRQEIENDRNQKQIQDLKGGGSSTPTDRDDDRGKPRQKSPWSVASPNVGDDEDGEDYRLYIDIGREDGTWMDSTWGSSGKRIPLTLDIRLVADRLADPVLAEKMVKDNTIGKSSKVYALETAEFARLRDGFDRMQVYGGAYRIDLANGRYTIRMLVQVEGTKADQNYVYGDVSIPKGCLYFSLPCFGGRINQLSTKEGPVTVRQTGWHTGWRRKESRILGVFNAKPIAEARRKDPY